MSALNIAFIDLPFISLLIIAHSVSNIGNPNTISGNIITAKVYVFAIPNIAIIEIVYPKKFEPVSPINVFAGAKLNGKNPTNAPASAVINIIGTIAEPFNKNIINNDIADITDIPDDNPSKPSIKFIEFVTPTIHTIVTIVDKISPNSGACIIDTLMLSILIPNATATIAASN